MMRFEKRWAQHVLAAFAPPGAKRGLAPAPGEVDYLRAFARLRRGSNRRAALGLRLALWLAALAPLWLWGKLATISRLAADRRPELLRQLLAHRTFAVRELATLLKLCAAMAMLGTPSVRERSGYDPRADALASATAAPRVHLPIAPPPDDATELPDPAPLASAGSDPRTPADGALPSVPAPEGSP